MREEKKMVSSQKIRFFEKRVSEIEHRRIDEINAKYPEIKTDYVALIGVGQGKMRTEKQIREAVGNVSRYACPPMVEVLSLFEFNGEREKAKKAEEARKDKVDAEKKELKAKVKEAMDLVYFGTDAQLKAALEQLEES
jgi:hypothetical protein